VRNPEARQRDAELARAALATRGEMPDDRKIKRDVERGRARWEYASTGDRFLRYRDGRTYHRELHGRAREVQLRKLETLGMTTKTARIVDKHLSIMGIKTGIKTGERVIIGRETALQRQVGRDRDELRQRMRDPERSAIGKAWAKAQDTIYRKTNAEGWRQAGALEGIRAKLAARSATNDMRAQARERLQQMAGPSRLQTAMARVHEAAQQRRELQSASPAPQPQRAPEPTPTKSQGRDYGFER
jgi:hypothetical protein